MMPKIKTAVISAAGRGTRMKHLAKDKPKHLLPVLGRPFLSYLFDNLRQAGIDKIIVVSGHHADQIEKFVKSLDYPVTVINQFDILGEQIYGTACPIRIVRDIIGAEQFLAVAGDNYYRVEDILRVMRDDNMNYIGASQTDHPERMGVLVTDSAGHLTRIVEKPSEYLGNQINASIYKFTPEIFDIVDKIGLSPRGEYELTDAIAALAKDKKVKVIPLDGFWMDFGRPEDIGKLEKYLQRK